MINIAAQLYTVRDFLKTPQEVKESLKKIKAIGYNAAQVSGIGPIDPFILKEMADEIGIKLIACHIPLERFREDLEGVISDCKIIGYDYVGIGGFFLGQNIPDKYIEFAKEYEEYAKRLVENGFKVTYHNHNFEFQKFGSETALELIVKNSSSFSILFDTYWVHAGGSDICDWLYKLKNRIEIVHLKDMRMDYNTQTMAEVLEGNFNWDKIIKACKEIGVKWYIVEQDVCPRDPFESLKISYNNLMKKNY